MKAVAAKVGIHFVECSNQGLPSQWVQCMDEAVTAKASLIILDAGPNPAVLQPQIAAAHAAGIRVISTNTPEPVQCSRNPKYVSRRFGAIPICEPVGTIPAAVTKNMDGLVPAPFAPSAILEADGITYNSAGHANVLIVQSPDLYDSSAIVTMIKNEFRTRCGSGCTTTVIGAPVSDWATKIPTEVSTALTKNPKINYVLPIFDSMSTYVQSGILSVGRTAKVKIGATFNGTPSILSMISSGQVLMDVGQSLAWTAWASMDQAMRVLARKSPVPDELIPLRIFDKSNIRSAGTPPSASKGYGNTFMTGYEKLWGLPTK
jgi:ribose transport system substrate-binding protein